MEGDKKEETLSTVVWFLMERLCIFSETGSSLLAAWRTTLAIAFMKGSCGLEKDKDKKNKLAYTYVLPRHFDCLLAQCCLILCPVMCNRRDKKRIASAHCMCRLVHFHSPRNDRTLLELGKERNVSEMRNNRFQAVASDDDDFPTCPGCQKQVWPSERSLKALGVRASSFCDVLKS